MRSGPMRMRVEPSCTASGSVSSQPGRCTVGNLRTGLAVGTGLPRALGPVIGLEAQALHGIIPSRARRRSRSCSQGKVCCGRSSNSS